MSKNSRREKLADAAKRLGLRMPQVQLLLAQERFLERLVTVDQKHCMIWKGGSLLLRRYSAIQPPRYTTDLDLLVRGVTVADAVALLAQAAKTPLKDGFSFSLQGTTPMKRETPYGGERLEIAWTFEGKANSEALRIDLCAGDDVDSLAIRLNDLFLEDSSAPALSIHIYPPEFIFAEKLETLVRFGTGNTRLKDFIDLWSLTKLGLDKRRLSAAIARCFKRRDTALSSKSWEGPLRDKDFAAILEQARKKNFQNLQLPGVATIFSDILSYLNDLENEK